MRLVIVAAILALGCGGRPAASSGGAAPAAPPALTIYPASRWIPAGATYAFAARTLADAQRSLRDAFDGLGAPIGFDASDVGGPLEGMFGRDPLSGTALADIGIDVNGGFAVFSEAVNPTFVVHLSAPAQMQGWIDNQRSSGMKLESAIVDGVEVFTVRGGGLGISWAIVDDWCWIHLTLPFAPETGAAWLAASRKAPGAGVRELELARTTAGGGKEPALVGSFDPRALARRLTQVNGCVRLLDPVQRVRLAIDGDLRQVGARLELELGDAAGGVARAAVAVPEAWDATAQSAALAAQWNLDYIAVKAWLAPCLVVAGESLEELDALRVRSGRAMLHAFDPDGPSGRGAVALELTTKQYIANQLDDIPMRSRFESKRQFGPHAGVQLSIPFGPKLDYVLTDQLALAAMGDGLLAQVVGRGQRVPGALVAITARPPAMPREAWLALFELVDLPARRAIERFLRWREGHVALTLEGSRLVLTARGVRL